MDQRLLAVSPIDLPWSSREPTPIHDSLFPTDCRSRVFRDRTNMIGIITGALYYWGEVASIIGSVFSGRI